VPFEVSGGRITFPAAVAGIEGRAMLDSGATLFGVDESVAAAARIEATGPDIAIEGAFGRRTVATVTRLPVRLLGVDTTLRDVLVLPGLGDALLIGARFFHGFVIQLDYPAKRMRLLSREAVDLQRHANVPMKREAGSGLPLVKLRFADDGAYWLLFDTGSTGPIIVQRRVAERGRWSERFPRAELRMTDITERTRSLEFVTLPSVSLGPFELAGVPVAFPRDAGNRLAGHVGPIAPPTGSHIPRGTASRGILGYEVLRHFVVTIDYELNRLHLAPPSQPPR
jgi:hypothetical protein